MRLDVSYDYGLNMAPKMEHVKGFQKYLRDIVTDWTKELVNEGHFSVI